MKVCSLCEIEKPFDGFYKRQEGSYQSQCKECMRAAARARYAANREKKREADRKWREANREKSNAYMRKWRAANREKVSEAARKWQAKKRAEDPVFKLKSNLRRMLRHRLRSKGYANGMKRCEILGCTTDELIVHLAMQFENGMSLANHGDWHIDHIVPMAWAKTEEEAIWLNHYSNLQPLWAEENYEKLAN